MIPGLSINGSLSGTDPLGTAWGRPAPPKDQKLQSNLAQPALAKGSSGSIGSGPGGIGKAMMLPFGARSMPGRR